MGLIPTFAGSLLAKDAFAPGRFQRHHLSSRILVFCGNTSVTDHHCVKVSPIESILQYCFATPKPLKSRPGPDGCKTAPLRKPSCKPAFLEELEGLREALSSSKTVYTTGLVLQELLQGCRGPRDGARIIDRFAAIAMIVPTRGDHIDAARTSLQLWCAP